MQAKKARRFAGECRQRLQLCQDAGVCLVMLIGGDDGAGEARTVVGDLVDDAGDPVNETDGR